MITSLTLFLMMFSYITLYSLMPRFIISIRELYDGDLRCRWQGIDTGFGILSQPIANENPAISSIVFAVSVQGQEQGPGGEDNLEAIRLEVLGDGTGMPQVVEVDEDDASQTIRLEARAKR